MWKRIHLLIVFIVLAGCGAAPSPTTTPTITPTPLPPTLTPIPAATHTPQNTPPPLPTITLIAPSSFGNSPLQSFIAATDMALCSGSVPREFSINAERAETFEEKLGCLKQMQRHENAALDQQRTLYARGTCTTQPSTGDGFNRNMRISEVWALDDTVQVYIIAADALAAAGRVDLAREAYETVIKHYSCGWLYDVETNLYNSGLEQAEAGLAALGGS